MFIMQFREPNNVRRRVYLHLVDGTDGITAKTGQTGTCKLVQNGGTPVNTTASIVEVDSTNAPGLYYVELTSNEISQYGWMQIRYKAAATAEFQDIGQVIAYDPYTRTPVFNGWDSGAPDIDYKKIQKMIDKAVGAIKLPEAKEEKEADLTPVLSQLKALHKAITSISIPEAKETDLTSVVGKLEALESAIRSIPPHEQTDLSPVLSALQDGLGDVKPHAEATRAEVEAILYRIREFFTTDMDTIKTEVAKINKKLSKIPVMYVNQAKENDND